MDVTCIEISSSNKIVLGAMRNRNINNIDNNGPSDRFLICIDSTANLKSDYQANNNSSGSYHLVREQSDGKLIIAGNF